MDDVFGDYTTAQTATALIAAPTANNAIRVWSIFAMSDTAGTITFLDGTANTVRFELYPVAGGGVNKDAPVIPDNANFGIFTVAAGEALDLTTDITGEHGCHVIYEVVKVGGGF